MQNEIIARSGIAIILRTNDSTEEADEKGPNVEAVRPF